MTYSRKKRRLVSGLAAAMSVATAITLAGCSNAGDSTTTDDGELSGSVTVWSWNQPGTGLEAAIPAFNEKYPNVEVTVQDVGNPAIWDKITTGLAANGQGLADVLNIGVDYIGSYIEKFPGGLANLSEMGADDLAGDFPSGVWASGSSSAGAVYGIPYEVNTAAFFYRKDFFEQAGVDPASIQTWDQLLDAGEKIKAATGVNLLAVDKAGAKAPSGDLWQLLAALQGSFYFNADGEITLNNEAGITALDIIKEANDRGILGDVPGAWEGDVSKMKDGIVSVLPIASWVAGVLKTEAPDLQGSWGLRLPPAVDEGGLTAAVNGGTYLSVAESSPNKKAAWEFVKFALGTEEGQKLVYDASGLFPGFEPLLKSDGFVKKDDYFDGQEINQVFIDELDQDTPTLNYTSDYARAVKVYTDAQAKVLLNGADPKQVLDEAAQLLAGQTGRKIAD